MFRTDRAVGVRGVCALVVIGAAMAQSGAAKAQGLPPVPVPPQNPITEPKRVLGKILFWDEQLSTSNTVSCGTCHVPARAGTDPRVAVHPGLDGVPGTPDDVRGSPGVIASDAINEYLRATFFNLQPQITQRSANSVINAAYAPLLFWDGRAAGQFVDPETGVVLIPNGGALESQSVAPPLSDVEMAHRELDWAELTTRLAAARPLALATEHPADVADALADRPDYPELFRRAFGTPEVTAARIAFAIATYQRTLIADDSPWDRFMAGQANALTPQQQQGWIDFQNARCNNCHTAPLFTNNTFRNIGLRPIAEDNGRQGVTGLAADRGRFKVPTLRNVNLKATFMHNGQFNTLQQVLGFYAAPPLFPDNRDPLLLPPPPLPPQAQQNIIALLNGGLTDPRVAAGQFPFDRPTLFTNRPGDQAVLEGGGVAGTGGVVPRIIAQSPSMIGNLDYRVGLDASPQLGGAGAYLAVSSRPPQNGVVTGGELWGPVTLKDAPGTQGAGTFFWPLGAGDVWPGQTVWVQWVIDDPNAPGGQARSNIARVRFFCPSTGCDEVCIADYDRDGAATVPDIFAFLSDYFAGRIRADVNGVNGLNVGDIFTFLTAWFAGC
jgi:cytochrome c peroxidase